MVMSDKTAAMSGQLRADLVIIGGGIMGLWAALKAERLGIETILIDGDRTGSGASGGLLGALMAHMPELGGSSSKAMAALEGLAPFIADSGI